MADSPQPNSPSLLANLRQYRFQKRPNTMQGNGNGHITQQNNELNTHNTAVASSSSSFQSRQPPPSESQVYKRIRTMDSGSDSDVSPIKKVLAQTPLQVDSTTQERRLSNMLGMFPDISTLVVKTCLMKHNWNEEKTRDELLKFDPEQAEINKSVKPKFQNEFLNMLRNGSHTTMAKVYSSMPVRTIIAQPSPAKKAKVGRKKGDDSDSDNEYKSRKKDKVFDSDDDSDTEVTNDLSGDKKRVYSFLSTAKDTELQMLSGCSLKKAEVIMSLRPFNGWVDLVQKFQDSKYLNTDILNSTQDLLMTRNNIQKLMKKCQMLSNQLESAVASGGGMTEQPDLIPSNLKLAPYQMVGLNWLVVLHNQKVNGILADEMGLGKTVQVIAFLAHLKEIKKAERTHLIIVPSSTLENWNIEFARWCPSMKVVVYYGNQEERKAMRIRWAKEGLGETDVVLTTYNLVCSSPEEKKMFRVTQMHYVVFDEAHMLKNMSTQRYENLIKVRASNRILLTGTPLQNNLLELMSLLCFVMPHLFANNTDDLKSLFQKNVKATAKKSSEKTDEDVPPFEQTQISQAKRIMKPFLLRRLKRDVLKDLPTKTDSVVTCSMAASQQKQYKDLIKSFSASDGMIHATNEQSGMSMMMDMRKLANHPLLLRFFYDESKLKRIASYLAADSFYKENNKDHIFQDLLFMSDFQIHQLTFHYKSIVNMKIPDEYIVKSGKFLKLDQMLPKLKAEGHRVLIFSQFVMMLDVLEPYLKIRGHHYLRLDGSTAVTVRQDLIDQYNEESDIFVFLLSTRAGGLGINLTAADTVIIHDIDFNPYNDKQAEDRCHRMGQTRPVTIYRFLSGGTIEEGIYQVAQEKLSLERDITNTNENEPTELKNVVRLLNVALGVTSPTK